MLSHIFYNISTVHKYIKMKEIDKTRLGLLNLEWRVSHLNTLKKGSNLSLQED